MKYELAKQLKDAGFPQLDFGGFNHSEDLNYPTLSELIEACGEDLDSLFRIGELWNANGIKEFENGWYARNGDDTVNEQGATPEEAVAKLWLALNRDKASK